MQSDPLRLVITTKQVRVRWPTGVNSNNLKLRCVHGASRTTKTFHLMKAPDLQVDKKQAIGVNLICSWWEVGHQCKFTPDQMKLTDYTKLEVTANLPRRALGSTLKLPSAASTTMVKYMAALVLLLTRSG